MQISQPYCPRQVRSHSHKGSPCSNVDNCNIYFTNFPELWEAFHFWEIFKSYGDIVDVFIPTKRNFRRQRFGFIRFMSVEDTNCLILALNQIWIGGYKLRFYRAKGSMEANDNSQVPTEQLKTKCHKTYADALKGTIDCPQAVDKVSYDSKKPNVKVKLNSAAESHSIVSLDSLVLNCDKSSGHVKVSLEKGVLIIKINLLELVSQSSFDSDDSPSNSNQSKLSPIEPKSKNDNISNSMSKEDHATISYQNKLCPELNDSDGLGSPCFSVHLRSSEDFNLLCGAEENDNEVLSGSSKLNEFSFTDVGSKELVLADNHSSGMSVGSKNEMDIGINEEFGIDIDDELESAYLNKSNLRKKKRKKNHKWSRKKTHSKVKVRVDSPPKFTVEDTCISDSICRDEAIKMLEVAKMLGLAFCNDDESIIDKMLGLELQEQNAKKYA
ncbi:hypothetical protein PTKIN_Ptkin08bG0111400 [Pterospermum kingtungense]